MSTRAEVMAALAAFRAEIVDEKRVTIPPLGDFILRRRTAGQMWDHKDDTLLEVAKKLSDRLERIGEIVLITQSVFCDDGAAFTAADIAGMDALIFSALLSAVHEFYGETKKK